MTFVRLVSADGLLIARSFSPLLFRQGEQAFPTLLMKVLQREVSDEEEEVIKMMQAPPDRAPHLCLFASERRRPIGPSETCIHCCHMQMFNLGHQLWMLTMYHPDVELEPFAMDVDCGPSAMRVDNVTLSAF